MPGTRWFYDVVMGASYPSEPVVLEELERVFDAARPANIDVDRSEAVDGSFLIAHAQGFLGDIEIEVHENWADLRSIVICRQIRAAEFGPDWNRETAQTVDRIIRGHYDVDRTRWGNKIIRIDVSTEGRRRTTKSAWTRLPIPNRFLTHEQVRLDYGCAPSRGSTV